MYAYFGVGAVQVSGTYGPIHANSAYCMMYGDPGAMCGLPLHRGMTGA
jgi:hypothetical protein